MFTKLLLARRVPAVEAQLSAVGREVERVDLDADGGWERDFGFFFFLGSRFELFFFFCSRDEPEEELVPCVTYPPILLTFVFLLELARQVALDKGGLACFGVGWFSFSFRKEKRGSRLRKKTAKKKKKKKKKKKTLRYRDRVSNDSAVFSSETRRRRPLLYRTRFLSLRPRTSSPCAFLKGQQAAEEEGNKKGKSRRSVDALLFFFFLLSPLFLPQNRPFTCATVADQHELEGGDALRSHLTGESLQSGIKRGAEREWGGGGEGEGAERRPDSIARLEGDDERRRQKKEEGANGRFEDTLAARSAL